MSREYETTPLMLIHPLEQHTVTPDATLIKTLHRLLDAIPDDNHALMIDHCVSGIIKFRNPNRQKLPELEQS